MTVTVKGVNLIKKPNLAEMYASIKPIDKKGLSIISHSKFE
jgi:hypothetical protein